MVEEGKVSMTSISGIFWWSRQDKIFDRGSGCGCFWGGDVATYGDGATNQPATKFGERDGEEKKGTMGNEER